MPETSSVDPPKTAPTDSAPTGSYGPISQAIANVQQKTTSEIHVHTTKRKWEKDPLRSALHLFDFFGMERTTHKNAVLIYVNLKKRSLAIVGGSAWAAKVSPRYLEELGLLLKKDLSSTPHQKAIAMAVRTLGITAEKVFPIDM